MDRSIKSITVRRNVSLALFTTFQIGGKADFLCEVETPEDLLVAVLSANKVGLKYCVIAGGCNVVFDDKSYHGLVIVFRRKKFNAKDLEIADNKVIVPASIWLDDFIDYAVKKGWGGLEKLSLIPGTVGGAVFGNAGAYGAQIGDKVSAVEIWDGKKVRWLSQKECQFGYRDSIFKAPKAKNWLILRVALIFQHFPKGRPSEKALIIRVERRRVIADRRKKFYENIKCPGSFFKNVLVEDCAKKSLALIDQTKIVDGKIPAGYLLDAVNAKGRREGGIYVSDFHGNIILNDGRGTFKQVVKLADKLKRLVKDKFGVRLEEEVRLITN